jgi:hypothetical protein
MGETLAQAIASSLAPSFPPAPAAKPAVEYLGDSNQNTVTVPHQEQQPSSRKGTLAMGVVFVAAMVAALLIGRWTAERDIDARMAAFAATLLKDAAAAGPDASSRDASSLEDAGMNAGSAGLDAATSRPDAGGRADAATPARREPVRANLSRPQPQPQEPPTPVEPPEGFGIVAFEGRGTATIEDKSCRAPCSLQVPIGEHSVKMAGRRKVEKKIFVGSGGQTLRMP